MTGKKKLVIYIFVIMTSLWTCVSVFQTSDIRERLHKSVINFIVGTGLSNVSPCKNIMYENDMSFQWKVIFEACPVITYLAQNDGILDIKSSDSTKHIAYAYPGHFAKNIHWSGAAQNMFFTARLFENSDKDILKFCEEENDNYNKMLAENNAVNSKNNSENVVANSSSEPYDDKNTENNNIQTSANQLSDNSSALQSPALSSNLSLIHQLKKTKSRSFLLKNFYITDSSTSIDNEIFNVSKLLNKDLTLEKKDEPQILIFHTHGASEAFIDSRAGKKQDTIVGVGSRLAYILRKKYGYNVIHDTTPYDLIKGNIDRNKAYNNAADGISETLDKYPSIQVVIDLHRDGVGNNVHRLTTINGERTAQVMFFNGLSRNSSGDIDYLVNKNLQSNLAFSLQMKLKCMENYPDVAKPVYLKSYRYNMHLRERFLLIELGNENNTLQEAKNAMPPLADVLNQVLEG